MGYTFANSRNKTIQKNDADFWEGLGYLGTKFGLGFVQSVEGLWDFSAGGIADLFGAEKWAERQFATDWINYNKADEEYNAEGGWKLAGDIAGGIGSSAPALLTAIGAGVAVYFTGGAAAPIAIKAVAVAAAPLVAGLGAAGGATKESYQETGNLDAKAYGYGALVGTTEAGIELLTQGIGTGTGRVFKNLASSSAKSAAKATAKEVAETATKRGIGSIAKQLGADFLSEGFEEGVAEFLAPVYQRMTYDPNAQMATAEEIGYAALVGGISGILMTGAGSGISTSINHGSNLINGNKLAAEPQKAADVVATARNFAKKESENPTGYGAMQKIRETVEAYDKAVQTRGADSARAKMLLGEMNALNTAVTLSPYAERAAMQILQNPEAYAQHIQAYGMTDANGNPISISAEKLTEGIDMSDMTSKQGKKNFVQSVRKALSENKYLQLVASMETAGNLIADRKSILKAMQEGETFKSDAEYQQFIEKTSREDRKKFAEILGAKSVEDIENLKASDVNDLIRLRKEYYENNGAVDYVSARNKKATEIPSSLDASLENGTYHYKSGKREIAIRKTDSGFSIYDYNTDTIAENLTLDEVNDILRKNSERASIGESKTKKSSVKAPKKAVQKTENIIKTTFKLAKEVKGYEKLDSNSQASVRGVIRQALANGITEDVVLDIASVSARSGAKINIDQNECLRFNEDGLPYYINGFYRDGEITLNPESAKNMDVLMIHELLHNLIAGKTKKGAKSYKKLAKLAFKNLPKSEQKKIRDRYEGYYKADIEQKKMTEAEVDEIIDEEIVTHYAETLTNKAFLKELFKEDASTIERIVDFFTLAKDEYSDSEKLSRSAKKFLKSYKKMFDEFSAQNVNSNAYGDVVTYKIADEEDGGESERRYSINANIELEIDDALNNKFYRNHIKLTENTPDILLSQKGVRDLPLYMKPSHVRENIFSEQEALSKGYKIGDGINYHGLGKTKFIEVISDFDNITEAYRGTKNAKNPQRREKYFLLISKIKDVDGNTINVPIYINEYAQYHSVVVETNKVATVFGKEGLNAYLQKEIQKGNLVRIKKKSLQVGDGTAPIAAAFGLKASDNSIPNPSEKVNPNDEKSSEKLSLPDIDSEYLSAVESGDMETAQRMVDEAAKEAGYKTSVYHGTKSPSFYIFDFSKDQRGNHQMFFSNKRNIAETYGHNVMSLKINTKNFLVVDADGEWWSGFDDRISKTKAEELYYENLKRLSDKYYDLDSKSFSLEYGSSEYKENFKEAQKAYQEYEAFRQKGGVQSEEYISGTTYTVAKYAKDSGYDGLIIKNVIDVGDQINIDEVRRDEKKYASTVYVVFASDRVKSADPVTYDDNGNVIPLSERFNVKRTDIRYSLPDEDAESPTLSNVNKEREKAELSKKAQANTWLENFYIQAVNETYGIEKFLKQSSSVSEVQAVIQQARAARTQAQSMLGNIQYNIFTKKKIGKGLTKIFEPIEKADKKTEFEDYALHLLNIDRMTLRERSIEENDRNLVKLSEKESRRNSLEKKILALEKRIKKLGRTKEDMQIKTNLRKTLIKYSTELGTIKTEIKTLHKLTDNFVPLENKPVFGENAERANAITAEQSRKIVEKYDKANPEFKQVHKELRTFLDGLLDMRLEAGLISRESYDLMKKLYPNYVPSYRDSSYSGVSPIRGKNDKQISSTIRSAKGGGQDILDIKTVIAEQVEETVSAMQLNRVANAVYETALKDKTNAFVEIVESEKSKKSKQDEVYESNGKSVEIRPKNSQITFYVDGKKTTISVTKEIFMGFEGLNSPSVDHNNTITKTLAKINKNYTSLLTSLNPLFSVRNIIRDLQDAGLNSKHPALFAKKFPKAIQMMASNSEEWQLYQSMGGYASSIFDGETFAKIGERGFEMFRPLLDRTADGNLEKTKSVIENLVKNVILPVEVANAFIEQVPRFSEFLASIEAGDSVETAINNSAEVTTNFGRRGRTGKVLNSTVMPFLNAAIQGFDKIFRNVSDAFHAGDIKEIIKALAQLLAKALILGVAPMLLNIFMYGDDEDYKVLRDDLKEAYFLVKISDGKFIRIPRGRLAGVIGGLANRTYIASKGEDPDIEGYLSDVISNITPVENVSRTIFSPLSDAAKNKTWYGGEIEGREWDDTAPQDRYDESTSSIAIAIGKVTGWSPKKIHYVLDQYSGVIGDFVLPATTEKAETNVFEYNFTTDSVSSNKLSSQFYDLYEETQYAKTAGDDTAIYQLKRLNEVKRAVSEMQKEKKAIQSDTSLSSAEKLQKTRTIQILINEAFKSAIADYEAFGDAARETAKYYFGATNEETYEKLRYVAATRMVYGSEQALKAYNSDVYQKSTLLSKIGITYDAYFDYYFGIKDITADLDKNGNAIEGSRRTKTIKAINKMNLSQQQKLLLICASGYALKDGDIKGLSAINAKKRLLRYILNSKMTLAEKEEIAKMCGFTVKNGKIILKSYN